MKLPQWICDKLLKIVSRRCNREPDIEIGGHVNPYLRRWFVIPRNRWSNVYLHNILRPDSDLALHDHPWDSVSVILHGDYLDVTPAGERHYQKGDVIFRRATSAHRLAKFNALTSAQAVNDVMDTWTLFVTGPAVRSWGFLCPQGWVHWRDFTNPADGGATVGRGCGEENL